MEEDSREIRRKYDINLCQRDSVHGRWKRPEYKSLWLVVYTISSIFEQSVLLGTPWPEDQNGFRTSASDPLLVLCRG